VPKIVPRLPRPGNMDLCSSRNAGHA
jgi:hypothetical protein